MKNKKGMILVLICGFFFVGLLLAVVLFIVGFTTDKRQTREEMQKVQKEYVLFKTSIDSYNTVREKVYSGLFEEIYYETMEEKEQENKTLLKEAEQVVQSVSMAAKSLKKVCDGVIYPESSINTKCASYALAYEQVTNSFVRDVLKWNRQLEAYNAWAKDQNRAQLAPFKTTFKYIDANKDQEYSGKEEEEDGK